MKPIEDICKPDPGSTCLSYSKRNSDGSFGESKPLDLEFYYTEAKNNSLPEEAPEEVRTLWEIAQHLYVYTLFEKHFLVASNLYCAMAVELTMRNVCTKEIALEKEKREKRGFIDWEPGFGWLLPRFKESLNQQLSVEELEFLFGSLGAMNWLRNDFVHPTKMPLLGANDSMLDNTSHWLSAFYRGDLKKALIEWMEVIKRRDEGDVTARESPEQ